MPPLDLLFLGFVATQFGIRMTFGIALPLILCSQWLARFLEPRGGKA